MVCAAVNWGEYGEQRTPDLIEDILLNERSFSQCFCHRAGLIWAPRSSCGPAAPAMQMALCFHLFFRHDAHFQGNETYEMANPEHLRILKKGVKAWNQWRKVNPSMTPDLSVGDLNDMDLSGVDFSNANLSRANLIGAGLIGANFIGANLNGADLIRANLTKAALNGAILNWVDLSSATLSRSDVTHATFSNINLNGTKFSGVRAGFTTFASVDLSVAEGIAEITHLGPSIIDIDTIYRSKGKIPVQFLRGAGVPDNFIEYMGSLVGTAFEFYSCFISYSSKDQDFADRLFADLQHNGVRCWFAPHHVKAGEKLHEQIDTAIRLHERLLLILSPDSINSQWVQTEMAKARKRETKEGKRVLFPISLDISYEKLQEWECFDADTGKDLGKEIREYFIPDFTDWKDHDRYEESFKKLLRDLKKSSAATA